MKELSPYYESVDNGYRQLSYEEVIEDLQQEIERLNKENTILRQNSQYLVKQKDELEEVINKAIEYIENEMPCLWEVDDVWEDIEGNYQHNYKEYDTQILLNKLKGVDKE